MAETPLTLYIDLQQGSRIDMEAAAQASLAWAKTIKAIGHQIDPMLDWSVELESSLPGSQKIRSIIVLPENAEMRGMIKGAVLVSMLFTFKVAAAWGLEQVLEYINGPDAPAEVVSMDESDRHLLAVEIVELLSNGVGKDESVEVFEALEKDKDVTGIGVTAKHDRRPMRLIARSDFPSKSIASDNDEPEQRVVTDRTKLILVRPILTSDSTRRWGFQTHYGSFGAPIQDTDFLDKLAKGTLNLPMAEGITMVVDIEITEQKEGQLWRPVERVITKVVSVTRPAEQVSLDLEGPQ